MEDGMTMARLQRNLDQIEPYRKSPAQLIEAQAKRYRLVKPFDDRKLSAVVKAADRGRGTTIAKALVGCGRQLPLVILRSARFIVRGLLFQVIVFSG